MKRDSTVLALALIAISLCAGCTQPSSPASSLASRGVRVTGVLLEKVDGPPYSYLRLKTEAGDVWVAVAMTGLEGKDRSKPLTVTNGVPVKRYDAPALGRRLDNVTFGMLE